MSKYNCHDCGRELKEGDEFMSYVSGVREYCKCKACYQIDPVLRNFQKAEVYSRVVGYIRPVEQWNDGKKAEFKDRREFRLDGAACC